MGLKELGLRFFKGDITAPTETITTSLKGQTPAGIEAQKKALEDKDKRAHQIELALLLRRISRQEEERKAAAIDVQISQRKDTGGKKEEKSKGTQVSSHRRSNTPKSIRRELSYDQQKKALEDKRTRQYQELATIIYQRVATEQAPPATPPKKRTTRLAL